MYNTYSSISGVQLHLLYVSIIRSIIQVSINQDPNQMAWSLWQLPITLVGLKDAFDLYFLFIGT